MEIKPEDIGKVALWGSTGVSQIRDVRGDMVIVAPADNGLLVVPAAAILDVIDPYILDELAAKAKQEFIDKIRAAALGRRAPGQFAARCQPATKEQLPEGFPG